MSKRKCLTPGATYYSSRDGTFLRFAVSVPDPAVRARLTEAKIKRLERAFHDAMEPILADVWGEKKGRRPPGVAIPLKEQDRG